MEKRLAVAGRFLSIGVAVENLPARLTEDCLSSFALQSIDFCYAGYTPDDVNPNAM
jgi:hypothetical protein